MRHTYECPMRWADLDSLGHVNNVVYVDYLQEARADLMRTMLPDRRGDLTEGVVVVRHEVSYVAPLQFGFAPVKIECWVTRVRAATFTMAYEVFHEDASAEGGRRIYVRATTLLTPYVFEQERPRRISVDERAALGVYLEDTAISAPGPKPPIARMHLDHARRYPLAVRFSDVDVYRHVNNVKYFEYLQETRIRHLADLTRELDLPRTHFVVAQADVDYVAPLLFRAEPYDAHSEIVRLGDRSMTFATEFHDGEHLLARSRVVVAFWDMAAARSTEPDEDFRRKVLAAERSVPQL